MSDYEQDIPESLARAAHAGTSFVPEDRARQERAEYAATLRADYEGLAGLATTDEKRACLAAEFSRYREGYLRRFRAYLASRARCLSTMIAGPSRFPVRRMEKRARVSDRRMDEMVEFRVRALAAIRKALCPELAPIMAGDADAVERLRAKIAKAEAVQERMREANAAIRKHQKAGPEAQVFALVALGFPEGMSRRLLEPDFCQRIGFPAYELTNNGANIRRMKERLAVIAANKAAPVTAAEGTAARLEDSPPDNRVRLYFPGKPEAAVRDTLKRGGFRWTPSRGCWQAYRNPVTLALAAKVAGVKTEASDPVQAVQES